MKKRNLFILLFAVCGSLSSLMAQTSTVESNVFSLDTRLIFESNVFSVDTRDSYTVTFDLGAYGTRSGGGALVQTVPRGEAATAPAVEAAEGWVFGSWSASFDAVTSDLSVVAEYAAPLAPVLELQSFYESAEGSALTIDASPTDGYPSTFTYQWYTDGFPIPSNYGGTDSAYQIYGDAASNGTWQVKVSNSSGSITREFEYRVFADADGDGLSDYRETDLLLTDPNAADSDADGINDYDELHTYATDPMDADSDADGLQDGAELTHQTDPNDADSDDDGLSDGVEVNSHATDPNDADSDDDGLSDAVEINSYATDPNDADSDDDGLSDDAEINSHDTDPNDADSDGDGLSDGAEVTEHSTNPNLADSNGDGLSDGALVGLGRDPNADYTDIVQLVVAQQKDLRIGAEIATVTDAAATLQIVLEESDDLSSWSERETIDVVVPLAEGEQTKFFRYSVQSSAE